MSADQHTPRDLRDLFAAAGAEERAAAGQLDVAALRGRAHRRRAVRGTTYSAVGVAAAAAISVGALSADGLLRDEPPAPPATATTTASPTPGAWPSAITLDGAVPRCGEPMPALVTPDGEPELTVERMTQGGPVAAGAVAELDVTIHAPEGFALQGNLPQPLLVRDGVVVATLGRDVDLSAVYGASTELGFPPVLLELVRCETQGRGAVPLDAGGYDLYIVDNLSRPAADPADAPERLTVVGGPYVVTLEAAAEPHPPLEDLVITTTGLGPLEVGLPAERNPGAAMITYDEDYCTQQVGQLGETWDPTLGPAGEWLAAGYDPAPALDGELSPPFAVAVGDDGVLAQIAVVATQLRTSEGIGIGSTRAELLAAYPTLEAVSDQGVFGQVWRLGGDTSLVFATGDVSYTETTDDDVVVGITIAAPGYGQATSWGSGMMPGNCGLT